MTSLTNFQSKLQLGWIFDKTISVFRKIPNGNWSLRCSRKFMTFDCRLSKNTSSKFKCRIADVYSLCEWNKIGTLMTCRDHHNQDELLCSYMHSREQIIHELSLRPSYRGGKKSLHLPLSLFWRGNDLAE